MDSCIFCMVAAKEIDARIVYEDDAVLAFDDITPQAPVHTLVIPKAHYADLSDDVPAETVRALFGAVQKVAAIKGVEETGYRVIVNNGHDASQTIHHLHVHILGGALMSHGMVYYD